MQQGVAPEVVVLVAQPVILEFVKAVVLAKREAVQIVHAAARAPDSTRVGDPVALAWARLSGFESVSARLADGRESQRSSAHGVAKWRMLTRVRFGSFELQDIAHDSSKRSAAPHARPIRIRKATSPHLPIMNVDALFAEVRPPRGRR